MELTLAKDVEDFLQQQVREGVCTDASNLVNDVLRAIRDQQFSPLTVTPELEAWLLEAADKPLTPLTDADFAGIRERVRRRVEPSAKWMSARRTRFSPTLRGNTSGMFQTQAGGVADRYLDAVEAVCRLLSRQPNLGPLGGLAHPKLRTWRYFLVLRPFRKHVLFYEILAGEVVLRRAMHGHRDLPRRLLETPRDWWMQRKLEKWLCINPPTAGREAVTKPGRFSWKQSACLIFLRKGFVVRRLQIAIGYARGSRLA
jgi:plasmid stabilization system protein ParE/Arc/MetJ-type ribon-helix-helix transcriptional regulator